MVRVGYYSGNLYKGDCVPSIHECTVLVGDDAIVTDEFRKKLKERCKECGKCPYAKGRRDLVDDL